ncbi:unnamed protein product [Adineta steineri]|uniref:G-protein coupled receptors family 1 profile domain-containing protein n=1 Tax=Adineta steineri TaxID=433720 RepID=A0A815I7Y6_9BILA|nr:unnamed protein product [Adineta steineri]
MSVVETTAQLSVWGPITLFFIGFISNFSNMIIFFGVKTFRQSPSTFYIMGQSITNIGALIMILLQSIPSTSGSASSVSCKLTMYFTQVTAPAAMSFLWLSAFDRWACTSRSTRIRKLSSNHIASRLFLFPFVFWSLICIPYFLFCDLAPSTFNCVYTNEVFAQVSLYFLDPIVAAIFPLIILIIFGILTYQNIFGVTRVHQDLDRTRLSITRLSTWEQQMTKMMISQTLLTILCTLPRAIFFIYIMAIINEIAMKSVDELEIIYFMNQLTAFIFGINFASSFYIFLLFSPRFRQTIKTHLKCQFHLTNNQVAP